jgi:hypothetical protein
MWVVEVHDGYIIFFHMSWAHICKIQSSRKMCYIGIELIGRVMYIDFYFILLLEHMRRLTTWLVSNQAER